jgi:hypothetical protein
MQSSVQKIGRSMRILAVESSNRGIGIIRDDEEEQFKAMAKYVLALTDEQLNQLVANGQFEEVARDD